jgi:hypothetical protein
MFYLLLFFFFLNKYIIKINKKNIYKKINKKNKYKKIGFQEILAGIFFFKFLKIF